MEDHKALFYRELPIKFPIICVIDSCFHYNYLGPPNYEHALQWKPKCLPDGSYAPVQCKGEKPTGKCYCFDATGNRIFGEQWWRIADNMTCGKE